MRGAGLGKIKNRDNAALWGTDSEHKLRNPDDQFYKKFAAECSRVQIAVDVFVLGCAHGKPCDMADRCLQTLLRVFFPWQLSLACCLLLLGLKG